MHPRTFHTVPYPTGSRVEQYLAPLDCKGPVGPMLDTFGIAASAKQRMGDAALAGDMDRWKRERETFVSMLRRTSFWMGA